MSSVSLHVTRPAGRALIVGSAACRAEHAQLLRAQGFQCQELDDPYTATAELCRPQASYNTLVLSLSGLYREELPVIAAVKRRFPHMEIWLTNTEGRVAALAEAVRLGADGMLTADGFHRTNAAEPQAAPDASADETSASLSDDPSSNPGEPVLTPEELRALLQDQPLFPPGEPGR